MARVDIIQADVLQAVVAHLRTSLSLDDRQCYLTIDPESPAIPEGGDWWITVSPGDGQFDDMLMGGGVAEQCTETATIVVTGYVRNYLDSTDRDYELLVNSAKGLLEVKRLILKNMSGLDPVNGADNFARELLTPNYATTPKVGKVYYGDAGEGLPIAFVSLHFPCPFDWDLVS